MWSEDAGDALHEVTLSAGSGGVNDSVYGIGASGNESLEIAADVLESVG
jgi:hypothetical protein